MNVWDLTAHQLDVIRTVAAALSGVGGFLGGLSLVYSRLAAKRAKQAVEQTSSSQFVNGKMRYKSVAETAEDALRHTQEVRGDITNLFHEQSRIHGRRRLPTSEIPTSQESMYD